MRVFWAIGWSMISLAGLIWLPLPVITAFGLAMITTHNLFDGLSTDTFGPFRALWIVLHEVGVIPIGRVRVIVVYPLIPWIGVMAVGYAFGTLLQHHSETRRREILGLGLVLTLAFITLRGINNYGDPQPWSPQATPAFTVLSFLNCTKYPPARLFLLMALGPVPMALALFDRGAGLLGRPWVTLSRVPLFFYLLQWPLVHVWGIVVARVQGYPPAGPFATSPPPPGFGLGLPSVYLRWLGGLILLYPACRWFAALKQRPCDAWLSYL
jgi:uncharacterized membrane protein